jgi:peptide/nickel transport system permease protein
MPEPSPSDARLLEPSGNAYELGQIIDSDIANDIREFESEDETDTFVKKTLGVGFWIAVGWFALVAVLALLAPFLTDKGWLQDPLALTKRTSPGGGLNQLPSVYHWFGTDNLGRDQFSRVVWGGRVSLPVGFASIALGLLIGTTVGLLSGYLKGWVDNTLMSGMDIILAFPALLLALSIITFTQSPDIPHISLAIGIVAVPAIARLVRANTLTFREREFVLASRTLGASHGRILAREILPNVVPPVVSFSVIGVAVAIAAEASLAFVGVGVPLPTPTWGGMIQQAATALNEHPFQVFLPCLILVLTIMAMYFMGDRLRQFFDVREGAL